MSTNEYILIIDTETTGLDSEAVIVEIGIRKLNLYSKQSERVYHAYIETKHTEEELLECWVFKYGHLNIKKYNAGKRPVEEVKSVVTHVLNLYNWVSYNAKFESQMLQQTFGIETKALFCVMEAYTPLLNNRFESGKLKYNRLVDAYNYVFNTDIGQEHNALHDIKLTTDLVINLMKVRYLEGLFSLSKILKTPITIKYRGESQVYKHTLFIESFKPETDIFLGICEGRIRSFSRSRIIGVINSIYGRVWL